MVAIVPRVAWGASNPVNAARVPLSERRFFVIHWPGSATVSTNEAATVRAIDAQHRRQGWQGIGYHYVVGSRVFEGRPIDRAGAHSPPRNRDGFGVCCLQAVNQPLSDSVRRNTRALYDELCRRCGRRLTITWHAADVPTACPGPDLIVWARAGMPIDLPPLERDDMTPEQDALLRQIFNMANFGLPAAGSPNTWDFALTRQTHAAVVDLQQRLARIEAQLQNR